MAEWDIDLGKISTALTDNGSSTLTAFKKIVHEDGDDDDKVKELAEPAILDEEPAILEEEQDFLDGEEVLVSDSRGTWSRA